MTLRLGKISKSSLNLDLQDIREEVRCEMDRDGERVGEEERAGEGKREREERVKRGVCVRQ